MLIRGLPSSLRFPTNPRKCTDLPGCSYAGSTLRRAYLRCQFPDLDETVRALAVRAGAVRTGPVGRRLPLWLLNRNSRQRGRLRPPPAARAVAGAGAYAWTLARLWEQSCLRVAMRPAGRTVPPNRLSPPFIARR